MATNTTSTAPDAPDTSADTEPSATPPRITKNDRVALDAVHIAAALPGHWTVGRGSSYGEVADLECLSTGVRIGLSPWRHRAWGYHLLPGGVPNGLWEDFRWSCEDEEDAHPGFAVGATAAEVATYIHETFIPRYHRALARAEKAKHERDEACARQHAARDQVAAQLQNEIASPSEDPLQPATVNVHYMRYSDRMRIEVILPVGDAIARAPALAHALGVPAVGTSTP